MAQSSLITTRQQDVFAKIPSLRNGRPRSALNSVARRIFLQAYEDNFGNVSAACRAAGIGRRTFYRWMESDSRINVKFREALKLIKPEERHLDMLEAAHTQLVQKLDPAAVIFGLKTKGRRRGWSERDRLEKEEAQDYADKTASELKAVIEERARQKGISFQEELKNYLDFFADRLLPEIRTNLEKLIT